MSSPDAPLSARRAILRLAAVCGLAATLAGCFQPMYGEQTTTKGGTPLLEQMHQIEVVKIEGRLGDELRNKLIFELTGGAGNPVGAPYKLFVSLVASSASSIVDTTSGLAQNKIISVKAQWRLVRAGEETKPPVAQGKASGSASIDVSDQRFANYRATRDAEDRAARVVVDQMRAQLIAFFVNPPPPPAPAAPAPAAGAAPAGTPPAKPPGS
ncbi:LPS assembly lipoprotein LptE [Azorhizobium doebereinerae]|uniref:LPS assembly lipoprotein LptE n=1 Tax=Azorhizobium doebereinerae TaxID=281091 RepID=UPI0004266740|nr:LPS assembly lipoprotein LptE [Azorhizobium doebereinerae]